MSIERCMDGSYSHSGGLFRLPYRIEPLRSGLLYISVGFFCICDEEPWS